MPAIINVIEIGLGDWLGKMLETDMLLVLLFVALGSVLLVHWHNNRVRAGKRGMDPSHLIIGGLVGLAICLGAIAAGAYILKRSSAPVVAGITGGSSADVQQPVGFVPSRLRLQFFGDDRLPVEISRDNVDSWFAYRSPTMAMTFTDKNGKQRDDGFQVPPNWAIFIVLDKPATYRQVIPTFSNPDVMPFTEIRQSTQKSIVLTARSQFPAGVLEITTTE